MTQTPVVAAKLVLGGAKGSDVSKVSRKELGNTKRWYVVEMYTFRIYQTGQGNDSIVFVSCLLLEHWTRIVVVYTSRCFSPTSGHMILLKMVNIHETCRSIWAVTRSFSLNHHSVCNHIETIGVHVALAFKNHFGAKASRKWEHSLGNSSFFKGNCHGFLNFPHHQTTIVARDGLFWGAGTTPSTSSETTSARGRRWRVWNTNRNNMKQQL